MAGIRESMLDNKSLRVQRELPIRYEAVDGNAFSGKKQTVLRARRAMTLRGATTALVAVSWLAVSNHCALGLAAIETHSSDAISAPAHDCCASAVPGQPKPAKNPATPCCKTLDALAVSPAISFAAGITIYFGGPLACRASIIAPPRITPVACRFLNIGPPGGKTFAESVLHRSLLAHAPPLSG